MVRPTIRCWWKPVTGNFLVAKNHKKCLHLYIIEPSPEMAAIIPYSNEEDRILLDKFKKKRMGEGA